MSLPTTSYYGAITPAEVIQPISKVLRLCGALVTAQTGDAVYPPVSRTNQNDERGLGRLVVHQENMPYKVASEEPGLTDVDMDASQEIAGKCIRSGVKYESSSTNAPVNFNLPDVDKFLALDCKVGDTGTMRVTAVVAVGTNPGDVAAITFSSAFSNRIYGGLYYAANLQVSNRCGFVVHWKLEDVDGTNVARVEYIITGGVMTLPP